MVKFIFTPSAKAFPDSKIMRTIDVDYDATVGRFMVNGKPLSDATQSHAIAFAIKQRLANSFVNASTAKNDDGGLLPQKEREALWQSLFDKVLAKIVDPEASPNWESVFVESARGEAADPVQAEVNRIVLAKARGWAKAKDKTLPKVDSPEYKAIAAAILAKQGETIRAEAKRRVEEVAAIDFDLDDLEE